tara:strand:+ start:472 stop:1062 length:591 start_codon:yes stop_codon:yes gene_type:complete
MNLQKMIKDLLKNQRLLIGLVVIVMLFIVIRSYNRQLGLKLSGMRGTNNSQENGEELSSEQSQETSLSSSTVQAANPLGMNSGPGNAAGIQTITGGINSNCMKQQITDPKELLPKNSNDNNWAAANPRGVGELSNISLLKAGHHAGIDTVGGTLRNANLQVRSEPPNPKSQVSPWSNSTIEPDLMRVPLELGCGSQ